MRKDLVRVCRAREGNKLPPRHLPQQHTHLKKRLFSVSIEWHSRLLLLTSAVFTTLVQWMGALQKNTPIPLGRACSRQEVRCRGTANESPGMMAGSTTGSVTEIRVLALAGDGPHLKTHYLRTEARHTMYTDCTGTDSHNNSRQYLVLHHLNVLSGAEGLSNRSSIGISSLFFTMRADRTVITFRALPSMVTANTTRTGGSEENCKREKENNCASGKTHSMWVPDYEKSGALLSPKLLSELLSTPNQFSTLK